MPLWKDFRMMSDREAYIPGQKNRPQAYLRKSSKAVNQDNFRKHPDFQAALAYWRKSYYWEAHEVFESLWKDQISPEEKLCLQAFIQICAAYLKANELKIQKQLLNTARKKLEKTESKTLFGISIPILIEKLSRLDPQSEHFQIQSLEILFETSESD